MDKMQHDAQLWHDLLWNSGGALELPKCFYQILHWEFNDGKPILMGKSKSKLQVKAANGEIIAVKEKSPYSLWKTLGQHISTRTAKNTQAKTLMEKVQEHHQFLKSQPLTRHEMWTYYFAVWLPSVTFPTPNYWITRKDMVKILSKVMPTIISKCGFNRNTKKTIIYGPWALGGGTFRDIYVEQGLGALKQVILYLRSSGQPKTLLEIAIAWAQHVAGTESSIFYKVNEELPHLDAPYLSHIREFLSKIKANLRISSHGVLVIQRHKDKKIMQIALESKIFTVPELLFIDRCRKYIQALTLSNIATPYGTSLDSDKISGEPSKFSSVTVLHHFNQEKPPMTQWKPWNKLCQLITTDGTKLTEPLDDYNCGLKEMRSQWPTAYSSTTDTIICTSEDIMNEISEQSDCVIQLVDSMSESSADQPAYFSPATKTLLFGKCNITRQEQLATWKDYVQSLNMMERDMLFQFKESSDEEMKIFWEDITSGKILIATDGSVDACNGTYGWLITKENGDRIVQAYGRVFGHDPSSYRTELYGFLAVMKYLHHSKQYLKANEVVEARAFIDNESSVNGIQDMQNDDGEALSFNENEYEDDLDDNGDVLFKNLSVNARTLIPEWDLLVNISPIVVDRNTWNIEVNWIKSHQDDKKPYEELDLPAQLNCDVDALAELAHSEEKRHNYDIVPLTPECPVHIDVDGKTITTKHQAKIRARWNNDELKTYIATRNKWTQQITSSVDWNLHKKALSGKINKKTHYCKLVHDILPTNHYLSDKGLF